MVQDGKLPLVGGGTGVWSFCHVDDAASATAIAVKRGAPGVYNIVDDDPAPVVGMAARARPHHRGEAAHGTCRRGWPARSSASTACR